MNFDNIETMLSNADRIKELFAKRKELRTELAEVEDELQELTGVGNEPLSTRAKQKCSVCGSEDHNKAFHKEKVNG